MADALGSAVALTDGTGSITTSYSYEPFGRAGASGVVSGNPFQYTGRENDGTELYYYRARYYHPMLERFIAEDPIGLNSGETNAYAYVGNDPLGFVDPLGLEKCSNGGALFASNFVANFRLTNKALFSPAGSAARVQRALRLGPETLSQKRWALSAPCEPLEL